MHIRSVVQEYLKKKKKQDCENVNYIIYKKENLIERL